MPEVTLTDISLKEVHLTERVSELRKNYFRAIPEICTERPRLITRFSIDNGFFDKEQISILGKANTYRYVLEHREPVIVKRSSIFLALKLALFGFVLVLNCRSPKSRFFHNPLR